MIALDEYEGRKYGVFTQAHVRYLIQSLDALKSTPTCYDIAVGLIGYYHSIEGNLYSGHFTKNQSILLESSKTAFAIGLTFCKRESTNPAIPIECAPMVNPTKPRQYWFQRKPHLSELLTSVREIQLCEKAIYRVKDSGQWGMIFLAHKHNVGRWNDLSYIARVKEEVLASFESLDSDYWMSQRQRCPSVTPRCA
jgi:hypothetical protein